MRNDLLKLSLLAVVLLAESIASAHGGGGEAAPKVEKPKPVAIRRAPLVPDALDPSELEQINEQKTLPPDVAVLHCKLTEFSVCRGVVISLSDLAGKQVAASHTGITGTAAFKGLKSDTTYIAKIDGDKYEGQVGLKGGGVWSVWATRRASH